MRIHYLLEAVEVVQGEFKWQKLFDFLDQLHSLRLQPGFEVMGNPGKVFTDFGDAKNLTEWYRMVSELATNLEQRYGKEEIEKWNFEGWNEPDT